MEQLYITNIEINKVRHLKNISIPLREDKCSGGAGKVFA